MSQNIISKAADSFYSYQMEVKFLINSPMVDDVTFTSENLFWCLADASILLMYFA